MGFKMKGYSAFTRKTDPPKKKEGQLSNYEIYQYYKNKEHITGADEEEKARKQAKYLAENPISTEPVTGTAPLPGIGRMKGVFDAFSKIAKHRGKMNRVIEADLIKKGYKIMPTKSSGAAKGGRDAVNKKK